MGQCGRKAVSRLCRDVARQQTCVKGHKKLPSVCVSTLYSYISKRVFLHLTNKDLWEKGRKKKQGYQFVQRIAHPTLPSISNRPERINQRSERGHWEMDLVVGRSESRNVLLTMLERQAREPLVFKLPNKQAASVRKVFDIWSESWGNGGFGTPSRPSPRTTAANFWSMMS